MEKVLVLGTVSSLKENLRLILEKMNMVTRDMESTKDLLKLLNSREGDEYKMIFLDMDSRNITMDGMIEEVKRIQPEISIIAFTSDASKDKVLSFILSGASEIIVKPFKEEQIIQKIKKLHNKKEQKILKAIGEGFPIALNRELSKAKKGKYSLTVILARIFREESEQKTNADAEINEFTNQFLERVDQVLFDTDQLMQFGLQNFAGLLPFCEKKKRALVEKKIVEEFMTLKERNTKYQGFRLARAMMTYPNDAMDATMLMEGLQKMLSRNSVSKKNKS